jgi:hypothetical protein
MNHCWEIIICAYAESRVGEYIRAWASDTEILMGYILCARGSEHAVAVTTQVISVQAHGQRGRNSVVEKYQDDTIHNVHRAPFLNILLVGRKLLTHRHSLNMDVFVIRFWPNLCPPVDKGNHTHAVTDGCLTEHAGRK